jgi:hypothetical protein
MKKRIRSVAGTCAIFLYLAMALSEETNGDSGLSPDVQREIDAFNAKVKSEEIPYTEPKPEYQTLASEINAMGAKDQEVREKAAEMKNPSETQLKKMFAEVDLPNQRRVKEIFNEMGFLGISKIGTAASKNQDLILIHMVQDPAFQKKYLNEMEKAAKVRDVSPQFLALLTDRVRVEENKKQIYGTQVDGNGHLAPVEDPIHLDERRRRMLLLPEKLYLKEVQP